jgi:hypothetical protein
MRHKQWATYRRRVFDLLRRQALNLSFVGIWSVTAAP